MLPSSSITKSSSGMNARLLLYWLSTKCSWQPGRYTFQNASFFRFHVDCDQGGLPETVFETVLDFRHDFVGGVQ